MRWLFLFVLVLNIAYLAWELNQSPEEAPKPKVSSDIPTILLLSEIEIQREAASNKTAKSVGEMAGVDKRAGKPGQSEAPASERKVESDGQCFTLGPFRELENLRSFTRFIKDDVVSASFRARDEVEQSMFWVYLPPTTDYDAAKALGNQLKQKKVKDYYIIGPGPQENGISLGHFKEKDRAYSHAANIKKLGFKPVVEPVFKNYTLYWLDYEVQKGKAIPESVFEKNLTTKIKRLDRTCS